jgi:hypothetical protein
MQRQIVLKIFKTWRVEHINLQVELEMLQHIRNNVNA